MSSMLKPTSQSAPKLLYFSKSDTKKIQINPISQGTSPTVYCVLNLPITKCSPKQKNFFFDNSVPLSELQMLGEASPVEPINQRLQYSCEKAKSECKNLKVLPRVVGLKSKKKCYFDFTTTISEVEEKDYKKKLGLVIDLPPVKLQPPPLDKFKKRRERCLDQNATIESKVYKGVIKRYNLKGRFGKINYGEMNTVVYEDDLVVSGVNLRQFKKVVSQKGVINVEFKAKKSLENGKEKVRPYDIKVNYL